MDILSLKEMLTQYNELELNLVDYINKENAQFVETEEMKILQAYADTTRCLIGKLYNEVVNPNRLDVRALTHKDITLHHPCPEMLVEGLKHSLNLKYGANKWKAMRSYFKGIDKIIKL